MFLTTLLATTSVALAQQAGLVCPITNNPVVAGSKVTEYNGIRFTYCCPGCDKQFEKDPQAALDKASKAGKTIGVFLFDPITGKRLEAKDAKGGSEDYSAVRYYFASADDKSAFDKEPAKYAALPKKEALYCPVTKEAVASYAKADGYADYNGVRYYFCCPGCDKPFAADPAKYAPSADSYVKTPSAHTQRATGGQN